MLEDIVAYESYAAHFGEPPLRSHLDGIVRPKNNMKQYMVIETFLPGCKERSTSAFMQKGRMMPEGLRIREQLAGEGWRQMFSIDGDG